MSTAFSHACIHSLPQPGDEKGSPDEILSIFLTQENREISPELSLEILVETRCRVVFDNEHSLNF